MGYKTLVSLDIAIIGSGEHSECLAKKLSLAGHEVFLGLKETSKVSDDIFEEFDSIYRCNIDDAASVSDVIILSTAAENVREKAYLLDDVRDKIIIDFTSSHQPDKEDINTIKAIRAITGSQHIVKCYKSGTYKHLLSPLFKDISIDLFMAGDSRKAKQLMRIIAKDMGLDNCYDFGNADTVVLLDEMVKCWGNLANKRHLASAYAHPIVKK